MPYVLAVDPGTKSSGVILANLAEPLKPTTDSSICPTIIYHDHMNNHELVDSLRLPRFSVNNEDYILKYVAIENMVSYNMRVGRETFETCMWIGRFIEAVLSNSQLSTALLIPRPSVKMLLCGSMRAKDADIRRSISDLYGGKGTKASPGPLFGIAQHKWSALAIAMFTQELYNCGDTEFLKYMPPVTVDNI